jgi:bla regulator protein blaR1
MPHFFIYLLKVNIVLIVFCLLYYFLLRRLTFYTINRWFLLGSILIASIFPLINVEKLFTHIKTDDGSHIILNYAPNWNQIKLIVANSESSFTVWNLLYIIYWFGVVAMIISFLVQIFSLISIHLSASKNKYSIWTTTMDIQPLSFFRNIYVNPLKHSSEELQTILQHERVHTLQWHTLDILIAEVNKIIYWFNPGVWVLKNAIRENLEFIADKKVLESGKDAKQYQYELLHVITGAHKATAIATQFSLLHLKNRIKMMNKQKSRKWNKIKYFLLIPILCAVAVVVAQNNNKPVVAQANAIEPKVSITKQENIKDFINRHKKIKTATWGYIDDIKTDNVDFKDKIIEGPILSITFKNEKFEIYQYNLKSDRIKFRINYGEVMPAPDKETLQNLNHQNLPSILENDYRIEVKTINGVAFAIAYDENWKEVSRIKLGGSNNKEIKKWEDKYGKIPPPPPPAGSLNGKASLPALVPDEASNIKEEAVVVRKMQGNIEKVNIEFKEKDAVVKVSDNQNFKLTNKNGTEPLYVIDGKITTGEALSKLNPNEIESVEILKDKSATVLYGEQGKNGVVLVKTKKTTTFLSDNSAITFKRKTKEEPLYVVNDVITTIQAVEKIIPSEIESVDVLKDNTATDLYGEKGKNGVIIIITKNYRKEIPLSKK